MRLSDLGEFGFIKRVALRYPTQHPTVIRGIGDDAAALEFSDKETVLFTTDQLIEGIHFRLEMTDEWKLGWKSLAVNLSDIAAMGGKPVGFAVSIGIPSQRISVEFLDRLYDGMISLANQTNVSLIGGDTSESGDRLMISLSVVGSAPRGKVVYRSGGRDGDDLYVTGWLGDAALGLAILKEGKHRKSVTQLVDRQIRPVPRVREGRLLGERNMAHAMIDISDGLLADAYHLSTESGLGVELDLSRVPLSESLQRHAKTYGAVPLTLALEGGEDYELLFSAASKQREAIERLEHECSCPFTRIGKLSRLIRGVVVKDDQGRTSKVDITGFDHFSR